VRRHPRTGGLHAGGIGLSPLSESDLDQLHAATLETLERVGVWVEAEEALDVFADGGCQVDRETHMVRIPPHVVEESIARAPSSFWLCGRDPENDVLLEPGRVCFANFTEGLEVNDLRTGEHRLSVKQDIVDAVTVVDAMSEIDLALLPVAARDCDHAPSAHGYDAAASSTTKHVHVGVVNRAETEAVIEMAALIAGGRDELRERPIMSAGSCTVSPLKIPSDVSVVCLTMARAGLPTLHMTMTLAGATGPVTIAGTLVMQNAEALAALTLIQLAEPGTRVVYGSSTAGMDLRFGAAVVGTPELALISSSLGQLCRRYGLPSMMAGL
jgi:trimethylamine--corrinoid protein Co-methyltransferase